MDAYPRDSSAHPSDLQNMCRGDYIPHEREIVVMGVILVTAVLAKGTKLVALALGAILILGLIAYFDANY